MIYKLISFVSLVLLAITCGTSESEKQNKKAWFIRICNERGDSCQTYLPTKHNIADPNSFDTKAFIDSTNNAFFGQKYVNYNYLRYIDKDTITILIQR